MAMRWPRTDDRATPGTSTSGSIANVQLLLRALGLSGFGSLALIDADFLQPDAVVQLGYPPARIDLLTSIDGVRFREC